MFLLSLGTIIGSRPLLQSNPIIPLSGSKKPATQPVRKIPRICCSNPHERPCGSSSEEILEGKVPSFLRPWDVPWDWKVTTYVMMPYLLSIVFTGIVESGGMTGVRQPHSEEPLNQLLTTDELGIRMFIDQTLKSVAKLSILYIFVSPHQPFPDDIFSLSWRRPFDPQNGWILWAVGGLIISLLLVVLLKALISGSGADLGQKNEAESLVRLLPLIGSSNVSTLCLLGILGVLAPVCEETLYRGFLLSSLTKWFSLPVSVILSSATFALAHQSPAKVLEIFVFGITLGLIYARTRNLLAPIIMHSCWNSGVIILLTYLHSQGQDIEKYL